MNPDPTPESPEPPEYDQATLEQAARHKRLLIILTVIMAGLPLLILAGLALF